MSTLDVVAEVLREVAPRALRARQIAELAGSRLPTASMTPATVVSRDLALDVRGRGATSRFLRVGRGEFVLKEALPTALYNDTDAYAAAWTRNLSAAGEIAAGVVDERSIRDLRPADVASYRQFHAFSGIGVWSRALRDAGWPDDVNVWSGSCPCSPFSSAGCKKGFADEQHLWPEWFRLISACRPAVVFGEQVSSKDGLAWVDTVRADLEGADYALRALDIPAACCGAPHLRQRLYFVAYARERAAEILGEPWLRGRAVDARHVANSCESGREIIGEGRLHDQGQPGDDAPGCSAPDGRDAGAGSDADVSGGTDGLGDSYRARGGRDAGEVPRAQEAGEGERIEARDCANESSAPGETHGGAGGCGGGGDDDGDGGGDGDSDGGRTALGEVELVRGATDVAGDSSGGCSDFRAGDRIRLTDDPTWGGAVRGYWTEDVEWIYCRAVSGHENGCWRPTRSGVEPLADGTPPGMGRTRSKRLRGYGNAIVLPLATVFVGSVIDSFAEAAREERAGVMKLEVIHVGATVGGLADEGGVDAAAKTVSNEAAANKELEA
jgi:DNA (cytosine-5)-methyltransferase 1